MNVCTFTRKEDIPKNKKITYPRTVVAYRPEKVDNPNRTRITAGGDKLDYDGETSTNSAGLVTVKCHWNSTLSDIEAKYCVADASNMYLESFLKEPQYVLFKLKQIPLSIQKEYELHKFVDEHGFVYARINKAWYGLKEAGRIANEDMVVHLKKHGYHESKFTPGLFTHETRDISFTLVVDDFGIKYKNEEDVQHLISSLEEKYTMKVDMEAKQYIGIDLQWDYEKRHLYCSMDEYIWTALQEFQHAIPKQHFYGPSKATRPDYGAKVQYVVDDTSPPLPLEKIRYIQRVIGKFLFLARALDNTQPHSLNEIACSAATGTEATLAAATYLLNYIASNPKPRIRFTASDMVLQVDSDAAFQVCPKARSRAGGYHYLGSKDNEQFNAPVLSLAKVIKNVMGSAAEAELAALHMNAQEAIPIRQCLEELGHPQPPTRLRTDNSTAHGFVNDTIKQKRSRTFDRQYWWLKDRESQMQFQTVWEPGCYNLADYYTKHHLPSHHRQVRPIYLYEAGETPTSLQGCNRILTQKLRKGQTTVQGQTKLMGASKLEKLTTSAQAHKLNKPSSFISGKCRGALAAKIAKLILLKHSPVIQGR